MTIASTLYDPSVRSVPRRPFAAGAGPVHLDGPTRVMATAAVFGRRRPPAPGVPAKPLEGVERVARALAGAGETLSDRVRSTARRRFAVREALRRRAIAAYAAGFVLLGLGLLALADVLGLDDAAGGYGDTMLLLASLPAFAAGRRFQRLPDRPAQHAADTPSSV
ncbi:hypothetical protein [Dactylosporangium sp. CS-033363]|uniref:hypothetical protein n=1 Tax=Dactylosporangium sp. CS-033363 TaxID=3239935 RepID=UPI003D8B3961